MASKKESSVLEEPFVLSEAAGFEPLFEGDQGTLTFDQRQLLVFLLRGPYLLKADRPHVWNTLVMSRERIEEMLNNLFLTLVFDEELGIAFCRQADAGDLQVPQLLREFHLTYLDSVLLLEMRQRLSEAEKRGERGIISMDSIEEILKTFDAASRTNERQFKQHVNAVLSRLQERRLLKKAGQSHMFEISPVLRLVFNAEEIGSLKEAYAAKAVRDLEASEALGPAARRAKRSRGAASENQDAQSSAFVEDTADDSDDPA